MRKRRVIALTGLSGAGKTTLVRAVSRELSISHFSASDLIKDQIATKTRAVQTSEDLRGGPITSNQHHLVAGFLSSTRDITGDIVLDCHTLVDSPQGIQEISVDVFMSLGIDLMLFLNVEPGELERRRRLDVGRSRPPRSAAELASQQSRARSLAFDIAGEMGIPFLELSHAPEQSLRDALRSMK